MLNLKNMVIIQIDAKERAEREYNANIKAARENAIKEGMKEGIEKGIKEGIEKGIKQGIKEGRVQGIEEGLAEGEKNKAFEIAKNAKQMGLSLEQIIKLTGLTKEEIESL